MHLETVSFLGLLGGFGFLGEDQTRGNENENENTNEKERKRSIRLGVEDFDTLGTYG